MRQCRIAALHERLREPAVGHILGPIEQPFGGRADEDVGQLPLGLEVAHLREPAELAVLDSPPIGRFEASDSHGVIVTCFGSDDVNKVESLVRPSVLSSYRKPSAL